MPGRDFRDLEPAEFGQDMPLRLLPVVAYDTRLEFGLYMLGKELLQDSCQGAGAFFFPQGRSRIFAQRDLGELFPGQRPGLIRSDGREGPPGQDGVWWRRVPCRHGT